MKLTRPVTWQNVKDDFCEDVGEVTKFHLFLAVMSFICPTTIPVNVLVTCAAIPFEAASVSFHTISNLGKFAKDSLSTKQIFNGMNITPQDYKQHQEMRINDPIAKDEPLKQNEQQVNNVNFNDEKKVSIRLKM